MPKPAEVAVNGIDTLFGSMLTATSAGQAQAARSWKQNCDLYADYFSALSKARGPEDVLAANAQLMLGGMDALARRTASLPGFNGSTQPQA